MTHITPTRPADSAVAPAPVPVPTGVSVGVSTKLSVLFAVLAAAKPVVDQIVALFENTNAQWTTGDKISLIASAAVIAVTAISRGAQEIIRIIKAG